MKASSIFLFAGIFSALAASSLRAAIWDGGLSHGNFTVNDLWSTPNNWQDAIPVSGATTDVVFVLSGVRTTATQNIATPFTLRSLTFSSGSNVTAVTGNQLNVASGGNIAQNSAVSAVVSNPINWNTLGLVTGSGTAPLALNATMSGAAVVRFRGASGGTTLVVNVGGANSFSGGAAIGDNAGGYSPVDVTFGTNTAAGTGSITFYNGNTIRGGNGPRSFANALTIVSSANGLANTFTFGSGDTLTFKGPINVGSAPTTLQVSNLTTTFDGDMTGTAALTKTGTGKLLLNGNNSAATGAWTINGGAVKLGSNVALPTTAVTVNAANGFDTSGQATVTITALNGNGSMNIGNSALTLGSGNSSGSFTGKIAGASVNEGTLKKIGTGTLGLSGTGSIFKSFAIENGTANLNGGTMQLGTGFTVGATLSASPIVNMSSGTALTCDANAGSIVSGPAGTSMFLDGAGTLWNSGFQVVVGAGFGPGASTGLLEVRTGASISGTFHLVGAGSSNEVGTMSVESGGTVTSAAGIVGFITGSIGAATVTGQGSQWTNTVSLGMGGFSAAQKGGIGTLTIADRGVVSVTGPTNFWMNGSKIDVKGGQLVTDTLVTNGVTNVTVALSDPDEFTSALTIGTLGSNTTYPGTLTNSTDGPGGITKVGGGTVTLTGLVSYTGITRVNAGRLVFPQSFPFATITEVKGGATLEFTGTWGTNTFSQTTIANGATLKGSGTFKGAVTNNGLIDLSGAQTITMTGNVVNNGRMRFKAGATFTGTGTLVNNGIIDIITAGGFTPPPGFVNNGQIIDRTSIITSITKVNTLVTISSPKLYGGHIYQLLASDSLDAPFTAIGIPFLVSADQSINTDLGEIVPRRFYRWKVD